MPMITNIGAAAARNFGFGASLAAANYIEDVFSTYLFAGNGSTLRTINGINLSGKGGLVWLKDRNLVGNVADYHFLMDTERGFNNVLNSNNQAIQNFYGTSGGTVYSDGFSQAIGWSSSINVASWTFRKQAKFFDIVTYTGTGANRTIAHNLGSTPGCIIVKRIDSTDSDWQVYHSGLTSAAYSIQLNLTNGQASAPTIWNSTSPTSSVFSVGTSTTVNASGGTYVAYIYASNAGGFGAAGTDNVITCGSFTTYGNGSANVTLGYEPQWVLVKPTSVDGNWAIFDTMRGMPTQGVSSGRPALYANLSIAEADQAANGVSPTSTGFYVNNWIASVASFIYIAIRRGPMKTPTDATKVFSPAASSGTFSTVITTGFPLDAQIMAQRSGDTRNSVFQSRLISVNSTTDSLTYTTNFLTTSSSSSELVGASSYCNNWNNTGFNIPPAYSSVSSVYWSLQRAPGFFDVVCYTGTSPGSGSYAINHNLGVVPELIIWKTRSSASNWNSGCFFGATTWSYIPGINITNAFAAGTLYGDSYQFAAPPTSTQVTMGWTYYTTSTQVLYLFATCPGVSKVGSYTGTGATQTVNCGFAGGARFVLIKRTDSTGDWYVWDTARGMVSGTDPSLLLNAISGEVNANSVYTATTGFQIVSTAAGINASGGTYIFLAIA
jgi:hypothetical protein